GAWATASLEDAHGTSHATAALLASLIGWGIIPATIGGALAARRVGEIAVLHLTWLGLAGAVVLLAVPAPLAVFGVGLWLLGFASGLPMGVLLSLVPRLGR